MHEYLSNTAQLIMEIDLEVQDIYTGYSGILDLLNQVQYL